MSLIVLAIYTSDERKAKAATKKRVLVERPRRIRVLRVLRADGCVQQLSQRQRVTAVARGEACCGEAVGDARCDSTPWGLTASLLTAAAHRCCEATERAADKPITVVGERKQSKKL